MSLCPEYDSHPYLSQPPASLQPARPDSPETCISRPGLADSAVPVALGEGLDY